MHLTIATTRPPNSTHLNASLQSKYLIKLYIIPESTFFTLIINPPQKESSKLCLTVKSLQVCSYKHCNIHINAGKNSSNIQVRKIHPWQIHLEGFNLHLIELALCGDYMRPGKLCSCLRALIIQNENGDNSRILFQAVPRWLRTISLGDVVALEKEDLSQAKH